MTTPEVARIIAEQENIPQKQAVRLVKAVLDACYAAAAENGRCLIGNGHLFKRVLIQPKKGVNPKTREPMLIEEKTVVIYRRRVQ